MKKQPPRGESTASQLITNQIVELGGWRGKALGQLRKLILEAAPDIVEEWKWGTGVWSHQGMICSAGAFKDHVKINFFKGASLRDPKRLFNAGLDAKVARAIDFREGDRIDASALKEMIRTAVAHNLSVGGKK